MFLIHKQKKKKKKYYKFKSKNRAAFCFKQLSLNIKKFSFCLIELLPLIIATLSVSPSLFKI